jgi:hypothetical protein
VAARAHLEWVKIGSSEDEEEGIIQEVEGAIVVKVRRVAVSCCGFIPRSLTIIYP